jgi:hypothetical protein
MAMTIARTIMDTATITICMMSTVATIMCMPHHPGGGTKPEV